MKIKDYGDALEQAFIDRADLSYEDAKQAEFNTSEDQTACEYWREIVVVREDTDTVRIVASDGEYVVTVRRLG